MIDPDDIGDLATDVGRRLAAARRALDLDQQEFGRRAGLSQPQYNQYENGRRLLTLRSALLLCDHYSLTLDWLYRGDPSGLPYRLANLIRDQRPGR
jgi:transcriptional regulator with XRE-family HTH domain